MQKAREKSHWFETLENNVHFSLQYLFINIPGKYLSS